MLAESKLCSINERMINECDDEIYCQEYEAVDTMRIDKGKPKYSEETCPSDDTLSSANSMSPDLKYCTEKLITLETI
jgi:hypothetical protein